MAISDCTALQTDSNGRELNAHGSALFPEACYSDDLSAAGIPWHWHDDLEVLIIDEGYASVSVNGKEYLLHEGEGLWINAGALHGLWQQGSAPCHLHSIVFHPRIVGGGLDSILWQKYLEPLLNDRSLNSFLLDGSEDWHKDAVACIDAAWKADVTEEDGYEFEMREELSRLILLLRKHQPSAPVRTLSDQALRDAERIKVMLSWIQSHYREQIVLEQIADSVHLSANEALRCFKRMINRSPMQYLREYRTEQAAHLLQSTDLKIFQIAEECGFQDMSYFSKTFRQIKSCTPGEYRKKNRQKASDGL